MNKKVDFLIIPFIKVWLLSLIIIFSHCASAASIDWLGRGYDESSGFFKEKCISGDILSVGNKELEFNYLGSQKEKENMSEIFGKVTGKVDFFIFGGSASISITNKVSENSATASTSLRIRYDAQDLQIINPTYTNYGYSAMDVDPAEMKALCGNEFVYRVNLGSDIFVTSRLYFRSRDEYNKFKAKVKIKIGFIKKTFTKTKTWSTHTKDAVYALDVVANGGVTTRLQEIMDNNKRYCKTSDLEECGDTTEILFGYLFGENGYAADLQQEHMLVTEVSTQTYATSGLFKLIAPNVKYIDPGFKLQESKLEIKLSESIGHKERMNAFSAVEDNEDNKAFYQEEVRNMDDNIAMINSSMLLCQNEPEFSECKNDTDETLNNLNTIKW
jgi:hypothetical protein